jgi:hypothetical protein
MLSTFISVHIYKEIISGMNCRVWIILRRVVLTWPRQATWDLSCGVVIIERKLPRFTGEEGEGQRSRGQTQQIMEEGRRETSGLQPH